MSEMAIKPKCSICGDELRDYGALMFSPPNREGITIKWHVCKKCWSTFVLLLSSSKGKEHLHSFDIMMRREP